ncbi:MAG: hypothetical protein WKF43_04230 [Acidimicrobiales bacterium]
MNVGREGRGTTDGGATLLELLLAIFIGTIVTGAVAGALMVGFRTTDKTTERLGESHDTQLVTTYFPNDVASAAPAGILVAPLAVTGCGDDEPGLGVVMLPYASGAGDDAQSTSYRFDLAANTLTRYHCVTGLARTRIVVATRVSAAVAVPTPAGNGQTTVTLTVNATSKGDTAPPSQFQVTGSSRTPTSPGSLPTPPPPTSAPDKACTVDAHTVIPDPSR